MKRNEERGRENQKEWNREDKKGTGGYWNRGDEKAESALFGRKVIRKRA